MQTSNYIKISALSLLLLVLCKSNNRAIAQNLSGYSNIEISIGANIPYVMPQFTFNYDKERTRALTYGLAFNSFYSDSAMFGKNKFTASKLAIGAGLYLKLRIAQHRNFQADAQLTGSVGYLKNEFIYYPELKIKESFFISPSLKLVLGQGTMFYFQKGKFPHQFSPSISLGLCFML